MDGREKLVAGEGEKGIKHKITARVASSCGVQCPRGLSQMRTFRTEPFTAELPKKYSEVS